MSFSARFSIHQLAPDDVALMEALLTTFGEAFDEVETCGKNRPIWKPHQEVDRRVV